jgi:phosphoglycolate phosphatase
MINYIIWDFNGTILDDTELCVSVENQLRTENGYPPITVEQYRVWFRFPVIDYYIMAGVSFEKVSYKDLSVKFMDLYQPASLTTPLRRGVREALALFSEQGRTQILLSASQIDNLREQTAAHRIDGYFAKVLALDNILGTTKTDIAVQWFSESRIDANNALIIGDTTHDYEVSQTLGCRCLLLENGHNNRERLFETGAAVVEDMEALMRHPWIAD